MVNVISVAMVRRVTGSTLTAEQLADLEVLKLNRQGIEEIDNLEVFDRIRELHLQGNAIRVVENLEYLRRLEFLDVSLNNIDSSGLRACLGRLPASLRTINLSGNSCADDEALLLELQDSLPNLDIIVGLEEVGEGEENEDEEGGQENDIDDDEDEDDDNGDDEYSTDGLAFATLPSSSGPLDADEILKSIVERKCRLQKVTPTDADSCMQQTLALLQAESQSVMSGTGSRWSSRRSRNQKDSDNAGSWSEEEKKSVSQSGSSGNRNRDEGSDGRPGSASASARLQQKVDDLLRKSRLEASASTQFMETLKATSRKKRDDVYRSLMGGGEEKGAV